MRRCACARPLRAIGRFGRTLDSRSLAMGHLESGSSAPSNSSRIGPTPLKRDDDRSLRRHCCRPKRYTRGDMLQTHTSPYLGESRESSAPGMRLRVESPIP
jgi:hypothetical protein